VTDHHLFRDSAERRRAYGDRGDLLRHGRILSKRVQMLGMFRGET
jgi:hypothetical protein